MAEKLKHFPILSTAILLALLIRLVTSGLSWVGIAAITIAMVWFGIEITRWLMRPAGEAKLSTAATSPTEKEEEPTSLVYFLSEPRIPDEAIIRNCVASALDVEFDITDPNSDCYVMPFNPPHDFRGAEDGIRHFMVRVDQGLFAVIVSAEPYINNPSEFAQGTIRDKRLRKAVESHRAWLSIDLMDDHQSPTSLPDREAVYAVIGRILAEFAGPDCLAIYCPELQRCNEFDLTLIDTLRSGSPLSLFNEPTFEPIIEISDDNPKMREAVKEAKDRWPEFVKAFQTDPDREAERYIAKAEFREGDLSEFMWVAVSKISDTEVEGILMNDPHELLDVHRGAHVSFSLERLNDWIYPKGNGENCGGFTLDVLADSED